MTIDEIAQRVDEAIELSAHARKHGRRHLRRDDDRAWPCAWLAGESAGLAPGRSRRHQATQPEDDMMWFLFSCALSFAGACLVVWLFGLIFD